MQYDLYCAALMAVLFILFIWTKPTEKQPFRWVFGAVNLLKWMEMFHALQWMFIVCMDFHASNWATVQLYYLGLRTVCVFERKTLSSLFMHSMFIHMSTFPIKYSQDQCSYVFERWRESEGGLHYFALSSTALITSFCFLRIRSWSLSHGKRSSFYSLP